MSNIFSGGSHDLDLSNGATEVFIDVLMPAVSHLASDLASEDWDSRFAALLTLQGQNVMGRGAVGSNWRSSTGVRRGGTRARRTSCCVPQHSRRADMLERVGLPPAPRA